MFLASIALAISTTFGYFCWHWYDWCCFGLNFLALHMVGTVIMTLATTLPIATVPSTPCWVTVARYFCASRFRCSPESTCSTTPT
jgi:hypothetical protein